MRIWKNDKRFWDIYILLVCYLFAILPLVRDADGGKKNKNSKIEETEAIVRLSQVFGIEHVPQHDVRSTPPQFMLELFDDITDAGGLIKKDGPYNASTIVSFPDRDHALCVKMWNSSVWPNDWKRSIYIPLPKKGDLKCCTNYRTIALISHATYNKELHFYFNVSMHSTDHLLESEFHLFRLAPKSNNSRTSLPNSRLSHVIEIKVCQVLDSDNMYSDNGRLLIDQKRVSTHARGWVIFNVTRAVREWVAGKSQNHGLLVVSKTLYGEELGENDVRFAQRKAHHDTKQPILVVYTNDGRQRTPHYISPEDQEYLEITRDIKRLERKYQRKMQYQYDNGGLQNAIKFLNEKNREEYGHPFFARNTDSDNTVNGDVENNIRRKRSITRYDRQIRTKRNTKSDDKNKIYNRHRRPCNRRQMYVDFDEIGWAGWIISPTGYNAYHCKGACSFPLGQSQKPTNHATVQSIVQALRVGKGVSKPCCVPNKLYSISLLYFDAAENVILKQYDDMVAASCGCQ